MAGTTPSGTMELEPTPTTNMDRIWKYQLESEQRQEVVVPGGSEPLHAGLDPQGELCIWFNVKDPSASSENFTVYCLLTGDEYEVETHEELKHLNTVLYGSVMRPLVIHVFIAEDKEDE